MPFVINPFTVTRLDAVRWQLERDLVYRGREHQFVVPAGFVTDFATVPWWVQSLIPRTGTWTLAAVLHDFLCDTLNRAHAAPDGLRSPDGFRGLVLADAREIDGLFRRVMREQHVGFLRRWLMWTGVRWGALANPARRAGWWRDAPLVLAITAVVLAVLAATAVALDVVFAAMAR
jgi:hypothetical protein